MKTRLLTKENRLLVFSEKNNFIKEIVENGAFKIKLRFFIHILS